MEILPIFDEMPVLEDGFTGLEAAIVLIAFVVIAASFSYVILGAGFFTTQKAQETVHTGVAQASSSLEVVGNVYGIAQTSGASHLDYINMTVALTAGGSAMDLDQMVISYNDGTTRWSNLTQDMTAGCSQTMTGNNPRWCIAQKINADDNDLLDPNEQFLLAVAMPDSATTNTPFTLSIQPAVGAVLPITRTLPGAISRVQVLD
ncbi:MAG: archaellin/type IV pilin N-terminal domain-containing protein [Methanoregula sp.]|jgi:flagellin FlaB